MAISREDKQKYTKLFVETAREYTAEIKKNINILTKNPKKKESIIDIFIAAHSMKGQGILMQYNFVAYFSAAIEKIFREAQEGEITLDKEMLVVIEQYIEILDNSLLQIAKSNEEIDLTKEIMKLEEFIRKYKKTV
jgi:chemotaxis protein histidine kinase CheA